MEKEKKTFAVWVGSLDEKFDEEDIIAEFQQYGPIDNAKIARDKAGKSRGFGFVNFYSKEVAEVAANDMDGTSILGVQIKASFKDESRKTKDLRPLTDCHRFMKDKSCPKNCVFRHNVKARSQDAICNNWLQKKCSYEECPKRHPSKSNPDAEESLKSKVKITRCNSHNEFMCVGQCQNPDCTHDHYFSEDSLRQHIMNSFISKKKVQAPLSCEECGVTFSSHEEKLKHSHNDCNDDDSDDDGDDVLMTKKIAKKKSRKPSMNRRAEKEIDARQDTCDKPEPIGIFWDIENCPAPNGKSTNAVVQRIRDVFLPGRSEVEFVCVCDTLRQRKSVLDQLNKAEVQVVHVEATSKNAADDKLKQLMTKFSNIIKHPATVLLISGDVNFSLILNDLKHASNFHVILLHNAQASESLLKFAHEKRRFDHFTADLPLDNISQVQAQVKSKPRSTTDLRSLANVRTTELLISNLPFGVDPSLVTTRLSILSDNCGGKVMPLVFSPVDCRVSCVIRCPTAEKADRALVRLDGQDVCGSKITVTPYWGIVDMTKPPILSSSVVNEGAKVKTGNISKTTPHVRTNLSKTCSLGALNTKVSNLNFKEQDKVANNFGMIPSDSRFAGPSFMLPQNMPKQVGPASGLTQLPVQKQTNLLGEKVLRVLEGNEYWLPLNVFLAKWKAVHNETFDIFTLNQLKELVFMDGKPGRKFLCLFFVETRKLSFDVPSEFFHKNMAEILNAHRRTIPLSGIPGMFWSYQKKRLEMKNGQNPLLQLLQSCPDADLIKNNFGVAVCLKPKLPSLMTLIDDSQLKEFVVDFQLLLLNSPKFQIPVRQLKSWYKNFFGTTLDPLRFGVSNADLLLSKIPEVARVHEGIITFTPEFRKNLLTSDIGDVLKSKKSKQILLWQLRAEYYKFFGRTIGHDAKKLVRSLRANFQIFKNGKKEILTLKKLTLSPFEQFKKDLIAMLRSKPNGQIPLAKLTEEFSAFHGKGTNLTKLGFDHPNDLFKALEDHVQVIANGNSSVIQLISNTQPVNLNWVDILETLKNESHFLLDNIKDIENRRKLLASVPSTVKVIGSGSSQCFILKSKITSLTTDDAGKVIDRILYNAKNFSLSAPEILAELSGTDQKKLMSLCNYLRKHDIDTTDAAPSMISLSREKALDFFCKETVSLLEDEQDDNSIPLLNFCGKYHKKYGRQYKLANFGFKKAVELFKELPSNLIEVENLNGQTILSLKSLAVFLNEARSLLRQNNGAILQNQFLDLHRRHFQQFKPTDEGFKNFSGLLKAFPDVFIILPRQPTALIISKEFLDNLNEDDKESQASELVYSDEESVIVESEDFQPCEEIPNLEDGQTDTDKESLSESDFDSLDVSDAGSFSTNDPEWWMTDIPDILPPPEIRPEKAFESNQPSTVYDLITIEDNGNDIAIPLPNTRHPNNRMKGRAQSLYDICSQGNASPRGMSNPTEKQDAIFKPPTSKSPKQKEEPKSGRTNKKGGKIAASFDLA